MNVLITYDYELFFGEPTGTVEKCIIEPTTKILEIGQRTGAKFTFFIDTGHLKQLERYKDSVERVQKEYTQVKTQIDRIVQEGHDCQLHIHPHWEDCSHDGTQWNMVTDRYKLDDFSDEEIFQIVTEYAGILKRWTEKPVHTYRAGGWCLQPFDRVQKAFSKIGIQCDTTVFPGGKFTAGNYFYDYTKAPQKSHWSFRNDLCKEDPEGPFTEYPISSYKYSPLFFWRLFFLGRWNPKDHKPMGDGYPMPSPGLRKKMLSKGMLLSASVDGYFVTKLKKILKRNEQLNYTETVIIGHPKACTNFALQKMEELIERTKNEHDFVSFDQLLAHENPSS